MAPETQTNGTSIRDVLAVSIVGLALVMSALYVLNERENGAFDVVRNGNPIEPIVPEQLASAAEVMPLLESDKPIVQYIEALEGCDSSYGGACINVRSGPGLEFPSVMKLRDGVVLRVAATIQKEDRNWYKITFDEWVRYPERLGTDLYVAADVVKMFEDDAPHDLSKATKVDTNKRIEVDLTFQKLYAYEGDRLVMEESVSTGLDDTPTPRGHFRIYRKMPSRYMQGPIPGVSEDEYDLPGVPWTMYFTYQGAAIHGAYWHKDFGNRHSHGCINLPPERAKILYRWADLGTPVYVHD
jgi:lipoprotein-anchoring transpeptidase ErfK/SrfK